MAERVTRIDAPTQLSPLIGRDVGSVRRRIDALEHLLEGAFAIPGTNKRIGLDSIIGLVPVVGDIVTAAAGSYLVWEARNLGMSKFQLARMMGNVGFDTLIGLVPLVGDAADFLFRSNTRNLKIIRRHLDRHYPATAMIDQG